MGAVYPQTILGDSHASTLNL